MPADPTRPAHQVNVGDGDVQALFERLAAHDIRLSLDGDKLRLNAPAGALTDALKAELSRSKAALVAALQHASASAAIQRVVSRTEPLPLSFAHRQLWFLEQMQPGSAQYNIWLPYRIRGPLNAALFARALDALVARHEALRTRFRSQDGAPRAEVESQVGTAVQIADLTHLPSHEREAAGRRLALEFSLRPFDLAVAPLARFLLVRLSASEHLFVNCMHHIATDGWSMNVAAVETCQAYEAYVEGREPAFAPFPVEYVDFADRQQAQSRDGVYARQLEYWKEELAGAPASLELPTDRPRPAVQSSRGTRRQERMSAELLTAVKAFGRANDFTLFMTMLAAWQVLLHRLSGQDDVVIGSPLANRDSEEYEGLIGCFVNSVALRGRLHGNPTFREFLLRTKTSVLGAFDHRDLPFDLLVQGVRPERQASYSPVFQVMFALQSFPVQLSVPKGLEFEQIELHDSGQGTSRFDITLEIEEQNGELVLAYEYSTDLFDAETIAQLHAQYLAVVRSAIGDQTQQIDALSLMSESAERALITDLNQAAFAHDRASRLDEVVQLQCAATPDRVAVQAPDATLTYAEIEQRANQMAQLLRARGVCDGSVVGVCLDRIAALPVALLAVLKAGAAYLPLDPAHPAERLVYALADAKVSCVITQQRFAHLVQASGAPLLLVDADAAALIAQPVTAPATHVTASDLAYVIYTSGSTGRPKGVEIEHRNIVNFLRAMLREPGMAADDVLLAVTTPSFDIAGLELFLPLICGARCVLASRGDVLDGERLMTLMQQTGTTVMQATPSTWRLLLDAGWNGAPALTALCGGEAMPRDLARELIPRVGALWNMYGPTETTVWSTLHRVHSADREIPIGHAVGNNMVFVLDTRDRPVPIGMPGELCVGGEGVARGYRGRPDLTADKFVTLPLPGGGTERVYRTGDVVRVRRDLALEFVGRRDQQVKIRGHRIELGEIEAVLAGYTTVREAAVAVREDTPGDQRLVGYVVMHTGETVNAESLRTLMRERLPEYMVPGMIVPLAALPLTPNGKLDRAALPAPQRAPDAVVAGTSVFTPAQARVAAIWQATLQSGPVGLHESFFDAGGHSLLLVKVHAALRKEFGIEIALVDLFQHATIAAQASLVTAGDSATAAALQRARARAAQLQEH